jgi:hypothetical protein
MISNTRYHNSILMLKFDIYRVATCEPMLSTDLSAIVVPGKVKKLGLEKSENGSSIFSCTFMTYARCYWITPELLVVFNKLHLN